MLSVQPGKCHTTSALHEDTATSSHGKRTTTKHIGLMWATSQLTRRNATHKFWGKGHHANFEWMRPQQSPPKPSGPQVTAPIGHGCLTQSHHQRGNKHTRTQNIKICHTKKIKIRPLVPFFNGCARNHRHINPPGRGSQCP